MAAPAGLITNIGKSAAVALVGAGATVGTLHTLGIVNRPAEESDPNDWQTLARGADATLIGIGSLSLLGGAGSAVIDMMTSASALGETATSTAVRGGMLRAGTEALLGVGIGFIGAATIAAVLSNRLGD